MFRCWVRDKRNSLSRVEKPLRIWFSAEAIHDPRAINYIGMREKPRRDETNALPPMPRSWSREQEDEIKAEKLEKLWELQRTFS